MESLNASAVESCKAHQFTRSILSTGNIVTGAGPAR